MSAQHQSVRQVWDTISGTANGFWSNLKPAVNTASQGLSAVTNLTRSVSNTTSNLVNSSSGVVQTVVGSTDLLSKPIVSTMNGTVNIVNDVVRPNRTDPPII